ncbi:MAG: glucokinase [Hyphomonadaceae bacterium]|nr:glucokinase [Hyphomonadaceae bacterium]
MSADRIVVADIGGTHARFAIATLGHDRVLSLAHETLFKTGQFASLKTAWEAYAATIDLPRSAALAVACPVQGDALKFTNSPWIIRISTLRQQLGLDDVVVLNDFAAIGHAVANIDADQFKPLCGPDAPLTREGVTSIIGPGTGLGIAQVFRRRAGYDVIGTEGGHISFAPFDRLEDQVLTHLRRHFPRVSAERILSGPGLANLYSALAAIENRPAAISDDKALWDAALKGTDSLAAAALERFCLCLGACAGDVALAHGAADLVIAGGLGLRIAERLAQSGFAQRFIAKGRFESSMASMPVKIITHPNPGLLGAAYAFLQAQRRRAGPGAVV